MYQSEAEFQAAVIEYAEANGWFVWRDYDPRRNKSGWPDLWLWKNGHIIQAELKREKGKRTKAQDEMAQRLMWTELIATDRVQCVKEWDCDPFYPLYRYRLWMPSNWNEIEEMLT